jgi:uncharacterized protein YcbX
MRISSLHVYPLKSGRRIDVEAVAALPWGLADDRRWMVVTPENRYLTQREAPVLATVRAVPGAGDTLTLGAPGQPDLVAARPDGSRHMTIHTRLCTLDLLLADPAVADWLSRLLGRPVDLAWLGDPTQRPIDPEYARPDDRVNLSDGYPVHVTTEESLDALNALLAASDGAAEGPLPMTRFRPNVVLAGGTPWVEDTWVGRRIRLGSVPFRVVKCCDRCVLATTDQETGARGHEPLRVLARHRTIDQELMFGVHLIPDAPGTLKLGDSVTLAL